MISRTRVRIPLLKMCYWTFSTVHLCQFKWILHSLTLNKDGKVNFDIQIFDSGIWSVCIIYNIFLKFPASVLSVVSLNSRVNQYLKFQLLIINVNKTDVFDSIPLLHRFTFWGWLFRFIVMYWLESDFYCILFRSIFTLSSLC